MVVKIHGKRIFHYYKFITINWFIMKPIRILIHATKKTKKIDWQVINKFEKFNLTKY